MIPCRGNRDPRRAMGGRYRMKIAYALRRSNLFPYHGDPWNLAGREVRPRWFKKVRALGFDGIEIGHNAVGGPAASMETINALRQELADNGVPCVCVRGGGGFANPQHAVNSEKRLHEAITFASQLECRLVNSTVAWPAVE